MDEFTDVYLAHNWGKPIPGSEKQGQVKFDNHERMVKVNERLRELGLKTWFDGERMNGGDGQIKKQMLEGIKNTKVFIAFITKEYQRKVNTFDTNEYCYFEFSYAAYHLGSRQMLAVVMDHDMMPIKWSDCLAGELGNHLRIDLSGAFDRLEKDNDPTLFNTVCQMIYDQAKEVIEKGINPIRNPETDKIEEIDPKLFHTSSK